MTERKAELQSLEPLDFNDAEKLMSTVGAYLPTNYACYLSTANNLTFKVIIRGEDSAGWTLDGYVIPRLASGNMYAKETTEVVTPN